MWNVWTFSPASQPLLQRCIDAALLQNTDNEWTEKFGRPTPAKDSVILTEDNSMAVDIISPPQDLAAPIEMSPILDDFFDNLEQEVRLDVVINECRKNHNLFTKMAHKMSVNSVEKLFKIVFSTKEVDKSFINNLFHDFVPQYLKLQYSSICIDILTNINQYYSDLFNIVLKLVFEDIEIPNLVLHNYIMTLDEENLTLFLEKLTSFDVTSEIFVHNILMIYSAYKDCNKTPKIQDWICTNLIKHSKHCSSDRNYGKLFLEYLQSEKNLQHTIPKKLVECLEEHKSPFKRPCAMVVKELEQY